MSLCLALMSLIFGSLVGLLQGILVIRRWGAVPRRPLWWIIGSAIAWGVGYLASEQFLASLLWHGSTQFSQAAIWLVVGTTWGIIGAITGGGPCLDWTRSCEDSVRRRAEITRCCNPRRINLRKNDTTQRSSREAPGIRPHNRSHQPSASGSHFDNGVMKVILLLILRASEIMQRYSCSIIHVINDHTESGSTHGYPAYTCVPPQL